MCRSAHHVICLRCTSSGWLFQYVANVAGIKFDGVGKKTGWCAPAAKVQLGRNLHLPSAYHAAEAAAAAALVWVWFKVLLEALLLW